MWEGVPGSEKALLCEKGYQGVKRRCYVGRGTRLIWCKPDVVLCEGKLDYINH